MRPPYSFRNHTDIGGQFSFPAHADGNRRYPAQDGLAFWKAGLARPRPAGLPARRADMRPRAGVGGAWRAFRSAARCGAPAPVTADQVGNADAYVPHPWLLGRPHAAAECLPFLRVLDLRQVGFLAAQVEHQLEHGREGAPVLVAAADVASLFRMPHEHVVCLIDPVHGVGKRSAPQRQRHHLGHLPALQEHNRNRAGIDLDHL